MEAAAFSGGSARRGDGDRAEAESAAGSQGPSRGEVAYFPEPAVNPMTI
jgi:hypothetical protein